MMLSKVVYSRNFDSLCQKRDVIKIFVGSVVKSDKIVGKKQTISFLPQTFLGFAFMLACNDKHDIEGNPLIQYRMPA